jgi:hypothetical protein
MRSAALLSCAAAIDEHAVVNAVHSAPYVPAHDVAADVAQLRVLFEEMQLPVPTHVVHASNTMEHYCNHLPDARQYVDCTGMGSRLQYVLTMLQANRLRHTSRRVNYILVPCNPSAVWWPMLAHMRVLRRLPHGPGQFSVGNAGAGTQDCVLLSDEACPVQVQLHSYVACAASGLQVPMSLLVEPVGKRNAPAPGDSDTLVHLTALQRDELMFIKQGEINGVPCRVLFDTGASRSFVDSQFAALHNIPVSPATACTVVLGNGTTEATAASVAALPLCLDSSTYDSALLLLPMNNDIDVILGQDWLHKHRAVLDAGTGAVRLLHHQAAPPRGVPPEVTVQLPMPQASTIGESSLLNACQLQRIVRKKQADVAYLVVVTAAPVEDHAQPAASEHTLGGQQVPIGDGPADRQKLFALLDEY